MSGHLYVCGGARVGDVCGMVFGSHDHPDASVIWFTIAEVRPNAVLSTDGHLYLLLSLEDLRERVLELVPLRRARPCRET